jgi:outer membrane receptor protein involved in Fe transport
MSKKTQTGQRKSLLTGASVLAAAAAAMAVTPAMAQDTEEEEAIVVTGTRLVRQDFEAISPITTVGAEQLELTATLTTESLLNELPQIIPGNTRTSNNSGGFDYATVDLRGLGPGRTLVLVNGERVPVSSTGGAVDLNTIPASLISRVEVVTGGASAVYGSDALAGVVNFVLKDDYEGAEVNVTYGAELETGNVAEFEINGLVGGNFANGRGNMTAYASYYNRAGVFQSEYDYSRLSQGLCYDGQFDAAQGGYHVFPCDNRDEAIANGANGIFFGGGSATPPWGWIANSAAGAGPDKLWGTGDDTGNPFGGAAVSGNAGKDAIFGTKDDTPNFNPALALGTLLPATFGPGTTDTNCDGVFSGSNTQGGNLSFNDAGALTPRNSAGFCGIPDRSIGSSRYNYAPDNYLVIPGERIALTTSGHYDITDDVTLNLLINYTNSRTVIQLAPTPMTNIRVVLNPVNSAFIQAAHPDLWTALQTRPSPNAPFTLNRRTSEVGPRVGHFESNNFFFMASLDGSLGDNWDWNLTASYGQVLFNTRAENSVNFTAVQQGLAGCADSAGNPLGVLALPGCQQIDMFGPGTLDTNMANFIRVNTFNDTIVEENRIAGYVRGDLFTLPAGPVGAVFGMEYRDTFSGSYNDNEQRTGNIAGFNAVQDQEGQIDVYELYTEVAVPLVADAPFAHYLGLEGGFRRSNYSSIGNVDTFKVGGEWAPTEWLRFRAIYNEATRAPNVFEVFQAGDQGFPSYADPCAQVANQANCIAAPGTAAINPGVYPGFAAANSQVQAFAFGNPNLGPESAESLTYGLVFQPDWFPVGDLRATVDFYSIEVTDVIASVGAQFFLTDCYQNLTPASCARVTRDPVTGQVLSVNTTRSNQASLETQGVDIQLEWSMPIGPGQLTINELYSILDSFQFNGNELAGGTSAAIGGALPDFKSVLSLSYNVGNWTLFGRWSYTPSVYSNGVCATYAWCDDAPEASYVDLSARWNITDSFTLTANIDNVFDDYPPQTAEGTFSQANTDPQVYRVLGRSFAISGRYRF